MITDIHNLSIEAIEEYLIRSNEGLTIDILNSEPFMDDAYPMITVNFRLITDDSQAYVASGDFWLERDNAGNEFLYGEW